MNISDKFTLDDIRIIRDDFYNRHSNLDFKAMADEINREAEPVYREIQALRAARSQIAPENS
jgi:hypothetical protein